MELRWTKFECSSLYSNAADEIEKLPNIPAVRGSDALLTRIREDAIQELKDDVRQDTVLNLNTPKQQSYPSTTLLSSIFAKKVDNVPRLVLMNNSQP